jgi:hypothetical protein
MDQKNPFESPVTFKLHRAEYLLGFALSIVLILWHFTEIRWIPFVILFAWIDLVGYIPGAIAFRRSPDQRISKVYYVLYNSAHSFVTQTAVIGLYLWLIGPEWALLAIPFHVFGDRGMFGNFLKPFGLPFEPHASPAYDRIVEMLRRTPAEARRVPAVVDLPQPPAPVAASARAAR